MADFALFKMIKCTNFNIKDAACLHIVHILQHPSSHPTTKSTQTTIINALKKNSSRLPGGQYGTSRNRSTQQRHHATEGKSPLEAESVSAFGALHSLQSKMPLAAEKRRETRVLSNEEKENSIEDYVERETTGPRKGVENTEAVVQ